jgi:hypothetical protein
LLASVDSARSVWVRRELVWWLSHKGPSTILIVVTDGEVQWNLGSRDFDWDRTTSLNDCLGGKFSDEPLWVDLRWARTERKFSLRQPQFRNAVLQVAPPLYGKAREDLDDEDVRQYRRARRVAAIVTGLLAALVFGLSLAAWTAPRRRRRT